METQDRLRRFECVGTESLTALSAVSKLFKAKIASDTGNFIDIIMRLKQHFAAKPIEDLDLDDLEANMNICHEAAEEKFRSNPSSPLTVSEIAALALYTSHCDFFRVMNAALRSENRTNVEPFVDIIWLILVALSKCPPYKHGRTIFRGVRLDLSEKYKKDSRVTWHQFSSCSTSLELLQDELFAGTEGHRSVFVIELTSTRARDVSAHSIYPHEQEIILPPNTRFTVKGVAFLGNNLTQFHLEELPSFDPILKYGESLVSAPAQPLASSMEVQIPIQVEALSENSSFDDDPVKLAEKKALFELKAWLIEKDIVAARVPGYAESLYKNGIGSSQRLKWTLEKQNPLLLESLNFDPADCIYIRGLLNIPEPAVQPSPPLPPAVVATALPPLTGSPSNADQRLIVGDRVMLCTGFQNIGDNAAGPLSGDDVGTVTQVNKSDKPFRITADTGSKKGQSWWYSVQALRRATSEEVRVAFAKPLPTTSFTVGNYVKIKDVPLVQAQELQRSVGSLTNEMKSMLGKPGVVVFVDETGNCEVSVSGFPTSQLWSAAILEYISDFPPESPIEQEVVTNRLQCGDRVCLSDNFSQFDDASSGPLKRGEIGEVVQDDFSDKPYQVKTGAGMMWWYMAGALRKTTNPSSSFRLTVGDRVCVVPNFASIDDAAQGPLGLNEIGELIADDLSTKPYHVRSSTGKTWWYTEEAITRADSSMSSTKGALDFNSRPLLVGNRVIVRIVSNSEAETLMRGHGGWNSNDKILLGRIGTITRIDNDGDCEVHVDYATKPKLWNPKLLEFLSAAATAPGGRFSVGEKVCLAIGYATVEDAERGPLKPRDIGVVIEDDRSSKPYRVQSSSGKMYWYAEGALRRASDSVAPLVVGNRVRIQSMEISDAENAMKGHGGFSIDMTVMLGRTGILVRIDKDGDCEVQLDGGGGSKVWNPLMLDVVPPSTSGRLSVGEKVCLTESYSSLSDAAGGPLKPGDVGELIKDDSSEKPYQVQFNGKTWWYVVGALQRAETGSTGCSVNSAARRLAVGNHVRIRAVSIAEAEAAMRGHGGFSLDMQALLGKTGVITNIDSDGDCEVRVDGGALTKLWNPVLLEFLADVAPSAVIRSSGRLAVGETVTVVDGFERLGDAGKGPLKRGDVGTILKDDRSEIPFQVQAASGGKTWWYREEALVRTLPLAIASSSRIKVGESVSVVDNYEIYGDARNGPLKRGDVGRVVQDDQSGVPFKVEVPSGASWWYVEAAIRRVAVATSTNRLSVGENVTVVAGFETIGDAANGPLRPGTTGQIVQDDRSDIPFQVKCGEKTWWYKENALVRVGGTIPVGSIAVGDRVTVVPNYAAIDDASGGPLRPGEIGIVVQDDKSTKPYQVKAASSKLWWYTAAAIRKI